MDVDQLIARKGHIAVAGRYSQTSKLEDDYAKFSDGCGCCVVVVVAVQVASGLHSVF